MSSIAATTIETRRVNLFAFTGEVLDSQQSSETETVREQGSSAAISSRTWHHSRVLLRSTSGEERSLDVANAKVAVHKGQLISLVWGIVGSRTEGDYLAVLNHNTGTSGYFAKGVNDVAGPPLYNMLIIVLVFVGVYNVIGGLSGSFGNIVGVVICGAGFWWLLHRRKKLRKAVDRCRDPAQSAPLCGRRRQLMNPLSVTALLSFLVISAPRQTWDKQPPLAPDRNPLLGRWYKTKPADPFPTVKGGDCGLFFGTEFFVEFRPSAVVAVSRDGREQVVAQVTYRGGDKRIAVARPLLGAEQLLR